MRLRSRCRTGPWRLWSVSEQWRGSARNSGGTLLYQMAVGTLLYQTTFTVGTDGQGECSIKRLMTYYILMAWTDGSAYCLDVHDLASSSLSFGYTQPIQYMSSFDEGQGQGRPPGSKPYQCPHCTKEFSGQGARWYHIQAIHNKLLYHCVCGKQYHYSNTLSRHKKTCSMCT